MKPNFINLFPILWVIFFFYISVNNTYSNNFVNCHSDLGIAELSYSESCNQEGTFCINLSEPGLYFVSFVIDINYVTILDPGPLFELGPLVGSQQEYHSISEFGSCIADGNFLYCFPGSYGNIGKNGQIDHLRTVQIDHLILLPKSEQKS